LFLNKSFGLIPEDFFLGGQFALSTHTPQSAVSAALHRLPAGNQFISFSDEVSIAAAGETYFQRPQEWAERLFIGAECNSQVMLLQGYKVTGH